MTKDDRSVHRLEVLQDRFSKLKVRQIEALRAHFSKLSEANLRIHEDLDLENVLHELLESARLLTDARCGAVAVLSEAGQLEASFSSGLTHEEAEKLWKHSAGERILEYLCGIREPLRVRDWHHHASSQGLSGLGAIAKVSPLFSAPLSFLAAPVRYHGEEMGYIFLVNKESGQEFTLADEETLVMFASQAALVTANARRYREEQRARVDLEALIETSPVGVVVFDAKTGIPVTFNQEANRIVGELLGQCESAKPLFEEVTFRRADGREIPIEEFPLLQVLSTGKPVRAEEIVMQAPGGQQIFTLVNATPIRAEAGEPVSVIMTMQDMTPLEDLERMRAEFLGMVGHELRTPLAAITGSVVTLLNGFLELDRSEMRQFFLIIEEQADYMRELISDLLDVARIESGTLHVAPEPVELAVLVDRARNVVLNSASEHDILFDLPRDLPRVLADRRRIVQVLSNLISNAAQYSPERSTIRVAAVREEFHVAIRVENEGQGVPAERLPHLFRKYSRFEVESGGRESRGSGLGLAICKGIVEAHGGRIWAESEGEGLGTRLIFTLPLAEELTHAKYFTDRKPARLPERKGTETRVLVVDDDPYTLRNVRGMLSQAGYSPIVTGDPEEVPALIRENRPHLVLLDLVLPGTDGIEMMEQMPAMADLPVIFLSAYGRDQTIADALQKGASDYLVKPFSPTELVARVQAALRRRAASGQTQQLEPYRLGGLTIDYAERTVSVHERPVQLTATEYTLLYELSTNAGRVLSHDQLLERVWGMEAFGDSRLVRSFVKKLRRKLRDDARDPTYIFTEARVGYRMAKAERPGEMAQ